jgi:hypothetical protein
MKTIKTLNLHRIFLEIDWCGVGNFIDCDIQRSDVGLVWIFLKHRITNYKNQISSKRKEMSGKIVLW